MKFGALNHSIRFVRKKEFTLHAFHRRTFLQHKVHIYNSRFVKAHRENVEILKQSFSGLRRRLSGFLEHHQEDTTSIEEVEFNLGAIIKIF